MSIICGCRSIDNALAVQIFNNSLSSDSSIFKPFFINEIVGRVCSADRIGTILRSTEHFDFNGIKNVNHSLTSKLPQPSCASDDDVLCKACHSLPSSCTGFSYNLQLRRIYYTTTDYAIYSMSYMQLPEDPPTVEGEQEVLSRSQALRSLHYDWSSDRLYWIENESTVESLTPCAGPLCLSLSVFHCLYVYACMHMCVHACNLLFHAIRRS